VLTFTPPVDGRYRVEVADLHGEAGPRYGYCLRALTAQPDYQLSLAADRFTIAPGKPLDVVVAIDRREVSRTTSTSSWQGCRPA